MNHIEFLEKLETYACADAVEWAKKFASLEAAWNSCSRSDWMLTLLNHIKFNDKRILRLYACACVRRTPLADGRAVWDLLADERSKNAVIVAENYANGIATDEQLETAWDSASWDSASWDSAWAAAQAASWAAARDSAWAAARDEVWDAAIVTAWDAAKSAARYAAALAEDCNADVARLAGWRAAQAAQCVILRELVPFSLVQQHVDKFNCQDKEEAARV